MAIINKSQYKQMLWRNGKGRTAEIDRFPLAENYLWRLSCATISEDGEFSLFPGYDRWLVVISGDGVYLNDEKLEPLQPVRFAGEDAISCRLIAEEVIDLGLIFDRKKIHAEMMSFSGKTPTLAEDSPPLPTYTFDLQSHQTYKDVTNGAVKNGILIALWEI
jgi:hypothetical protein